MRLEPVLRQQNGVAVFPVQPDQRLQQVGRRFRVKLAGWFVQHQQVRFEDEGAG